MPDDDRLGGTRGSTPSGRRHRRAAEEPEEQPRRRRRSMEDRPGLSVADLVERHTGSRPDLTPVSPPMPPSMSPPDGTPARRGRPGDGQPRQNGRPGEAQGRGAFPRDQHPEAAEPRRAFPPDRNGHQNPEPRRGHNGHRAPDEPAGSGPRRAPDDPAEARRSRGGRPGQSSQPRRALPEPPFPPDQPGRAVPPAPGRPTGAEPGRRALPAPFPPERANGAPVDPGFPPDRPNGAEPGRRALPAPFPPERANGAPVDPGFPPDRPAGGRALAEPPFPAEQPNGRAPGEPPFPPDRPNAGPRRGLNDAFPADRPVRGGETGRRALPEPPFPPVEPPFPGEEPRHPARGQRPPGPADGSFPRDPGQNSATHAVPPGLRPGQTPPPVNRQVGGPPTQPGGPPTPPPVNRPGPGQRSMPIDSRLSPGSPPDVPETTASAVPHPPVPLPPPRRPHPSDEDAISMTTEMEVIGEEVQKRRSIDHTLARFSAVHDELQAEEREKKAKRRKLMPWQNADEEFEQLDELVASQTMAVPVPRETAPAEVVAEPRPAQDDSGEPARGTRLQKKKSRKQHRIELTLKVVALTAAVLVFVAVGVAWGFKSWIESNAKQVDALDPNSAAIKDAAAQTGDENFLLVGSDTRAGAAAEEGVGDENEIVGARSDTLMIAHVPANRERVVMVSFPRDLEVTRPACEGWDPKTGKYTGEQHPAADEVKINTAYQVGGPKCVTKMVQELSGLAINHFVGIDFHGFKDMVDAIDGVEVCVERPLKDKTLGMILPEAGKNVTITGDQALNFVRARMVEGDPTSDYGRIIRQQRFLSSLLRKAMSTEVLLDARKLTGFVEAFSKSTFGDNIGVDQLFTLGQSMQGVEAGRVTFITVPTVGEANDNGNEDLRVEDTNALFEAIRADSPLPGEAPAGGEEPATNQAAGGQQVSGLLQEQPMNPAGIKIQVLNGGNPTDGIAGDTAEALGELGFDVMQVGASPENVDRTVIKYSSSNEAQARVLAAAVPGAELVEDPSMAGALLLVIGPGFDGEVVSPTGDGAATPEVPENLTTVNAGDVSCA